MSAIRYWDGLRIELDAAVVMPDQDYQWLWIKGRPAGKPVPRGQSDS